MGLFSFLGKNKQGRAAEDSGRFYSKDDDAGIGERARAKRASNAGGAAGRRSGNDPMLPEKKRARRRLVGAIALALAAAVGLPMLLDSAPKPLAGDIAIQIPSKEKAAPLPVPGEPGAATSGPSNGQPAAADKAVAAEDSVDKDEEIIDAPAVPAPAKTGTAKAKAEPKPEPKAEPKADTRLAERERADKQRADKERADREHADRERADRADRAARAERERTEKAERLARERAEKADRAEKAERAERLDKLRAEEKARQKADDKPAKPVPAQGTARSDTRAVAILEGKPAERDKPADAGPKVTLQVAAMSSQEKAADLQARLRGAGISSHTEKFGDLIRVKVGPLSKDEAAGVRAKLNKLGL
jgi:DedD protein